MSEPNVKENDNQPLYIGYSPEEQALLKSCKNDAMVQRALPCAAITGTAMYHALKKGHFKTIFSTLGIWTKTGMAGGIGYVIGNATYRNTYRERFLTDLPDSTTSWLIRNEARQWGVYYRTSPEFLLGMECKSTTFWYTSVPMGILNGLLVTFGSLKTPLGYNPNVGPLVYIGVAVAIGLVIGTLTNHSILVRRFLTELPTSRTSREYRKEYENVPDQDIIRQAQKETDDILYYAYPSSILLSSAWVMSATKGLGFVHPYFGLWTQTVLCAIVGFNLGLYVAN